MTEQTSRRNSWGPFTGRQLTTIICVLSVMLLLPVSAWATVSFTNVAITDPGGVNRAKVDSTGALAVAARPALPTKPIVITATGTPLVSGNPVPVLLYGPAAKAFGLTSLTISSFGFGCATNPHFTLYSVVTGGATYVLEEVDVPAEGTLHLVFPAPLVTTPPVGGTVSLTAEATVCPVIVSGVGIQS